MAAFMVLHRHDDMVCLDPANRAVLTCTMQHGVTGFSCTCDSVSAISGLQRCKADEIWLEVTEPQCDLACVSMDMPVCLQSTCCGGCSS